MFNKLQGNMSENKDLTPYDNPLEGGMPSDSDWSVIPASDDFRELVVNPDDFEEERLSALQIAGLTNEEIDARIKKLEDDLVKRWENKKLLVRDLENLGPAPSRMDALVDALKDEFESPQNALAFVKYLIKKGPTPQQKLVQVATITYNVVRKIAACVAEIRRRENIVRQQITEGDVILSKTEEVKNLSRQRAYNRMGDAAKSINERHVQAGTAINEAINGVGSNAEQIRKNAEEADSMSSNATGFDANIDNALDDILGGLKD